MKYHLSLLGQPIGKSTEITAQIMTAFLVLITPTPLEIHNDVTVDPTPPIVVLKRDCPTPSSSHIMCGTQNLILALPVVFDVFHSQTLCNKWGGHKMLKLIRNMFH